MRELFLARTKKATKGYKLLLLTPCEKGYDAISEVDTAIFEVNTAIFEVNTAIFEVVVEEEAVFISVVNTWWIQLYLR